MKICGSSAQRTLLVQLSHLVDQDPLLSALIRNDARHFPGLIIEAVQSDDWASLTFVGELHRFSIRLPGAHVAIHDIRTRLDRLLVVRELTIADHIVAEIAVVDTVAAGKDVVVIIDALTLHD